MFLEEFSFGWYQFNVTLSSSAEAGPSESLRRDAERAFKFSLPSPELPTLYCSIMSLLSSPLSFSQIARFAY